VGLEIKSSELIKVGGTAAVVALLGIVAPFGLGWGIMHIWGAPSIEAIFVGAAMVATSVGITAQALAAKGLLDVAASKVILAAAVIDDVLGLIVLAVASSVARGSINVPQLALTAVVAIAFTAIVAKWGSQAMGRVVPRVQHRLRAGDVEFNLAMITLFGLALLATFAGVAAIIGAFLAGMALSETIQTRVHDLVHGVSELLIPFFLVGIGLHFDISVFSKPQMLVLSLVTVLAAVVSKLVGCGIGAYRMGWNDALRIGVGMTPRGEVGMVVAQIGLGFGVLPPDIYAVVVFMAVVTTLLAPPMLNHVFQGVHAQARTEDFSIR
jgi:Kef-type K+ transport system membrane component KefB